MKTVLAMALIVLEGGGPRIEFTRAVLVSALHQPIFQWTNKIIEERKNNHLPSHNTGTIPTFTNQYSHVWIKVASQRRLNLLVFMSNKWSGFHSTIRVDKCQAAASKSCATKSSSIHTRSPYKDLIKLFQWLAACNSCQKKMNRKWHFGSSNLVIPKLALILEWYFDGNPSLKVHRKAQPSQTCCRTTQTSPLTQTSQTRPVADYSHAHNSKQVQFLGFPSLWMLAFDWLSIQKRFAQCLEIF